MLPLPRPIQPELIHYYSVGSVRGLYMVKLEISRNIQGQKVCCCDRVENYQY